MGCNIFIDKNLFFWN